MDGSQNTTEKQRTLVRHVRRAARWALSGARATLLQDWRDGLQTNKDILIGELVTKCGARWRREPLHAVPCRYQEKQRGWRVQIPGRQKREPASATRIVDDVTQASCVACQPCLFARAKAVHPESVLSDREHTHTDGSVSWLDTTVIPSERGLCSRSDWIDVRTDEPKKWRGIPHDGP